MKNAPVHARPLGSCCEAYSFEKPPNPTSKSMISKRNQCFSLISWSELGPLKQVAADMLTAGQVAPQSQLEESANDRGEAGSMNVLEGMRIGPETENGRLPLQNLVQA